MGGGGLALYWFSHRIWLIMEDVIQHISDANPTFDDSGQSLCIRPVHTQTEKAILSCHRWLCNAVPGHQANRWTNHKRVDNVHWRPNLYALWSAFSAQHSGVYILYSTLSKAGHPEITVALLVGSPCLALWLAASCWLLAVGSCRREEVSSSARQLP